MADAKDGKLKTYFITGLIVLLPIMLTIIALQFFVNIIFSIVINLFPFLPKLPFKLEIITTLIALILLTFFIGWLVNRFLKDKLQIFLDHVFTRIPVIRFLYSSTKQVTEAILSSHKEAFSRVVLVPFPNKNVYSIGFVTREKLDIGKDFIAVFLPQSPLPTSGLLILVKKSEIIELEMSVEEAMKLILTSGIMDEKLYKKR